MVISSGSFLRHSALIKPTSEKGRERVDSRIRHFRACLRLFAVFFSLDTSDISGQGNRVLCPVV